uniref:Uncharacterized protein n=1 Tax=Arundo donax TaxID=35708 RepID=A0A0A9H752_ARUDO
MAVQVCPWRPLDFVWFLHSTPPKLCDCNCVCFLYPLAVCCNARVEFQISRDFAIYANKIIKSTSYVAKICSLVSS